MGSRLVGSHTPLALKSDKQTNRKKHEIETYSENDTKKVPKRVTKRSPNLPISIKNGYKKRCKFALRFGCDSEAHSHQELADNL